MVTVTVRVRVMDRTSIQRPRPTGVLTLLSDGDTVLKPLYMLE